MELTIDLYDTNENVNILRLLCTDERGVTFEFSSHPDKGVEHISQIFSEDAVKMAKMILLFYEDEVITKKQVI